MELIAQECARGGIQRHNLSYQSWSAFGATVFLNKVMAEELDEQELFALEGDDEFNEIEGSDSENDSVEAQSSSATGSLGKRAFFDLGGLNAYVVVFFISWC